MGDRDPTCITAGDQATNGCLVAVVLLGLTAIRNIVIVLLSPVTITLTLLLIPSER